MNTDLSATGAVLAPSPLMAEGQQRAIDPEYFKVSNFSQIYADTLNAQPKRKIGGAFLYENTLTYLFSRTNYGKSILAFQLAYAAATGSSMADCEALRNDCPPMKVMVVDLEMDNETIGERHQKAFENLDPTLAENLTYLHEKLDRTMEFGIDLLLRIEKSVYQYHPQLIIIDNISRLLPDAVKADHAALMVNFLNHMMKQNNASLLIIGHTTKINPRIAIQPVSYFGSSMIQNFFTEISYLDMTRDGNFFLCHSKTKHKECYADTVPVFTRGEHPQIGLGFNYQGLQALSDVQLPFELMSEKSHKKRNLKRFIEEINILCRAGISVQRIADMFDVTTRSVYNLKDSTGLFSGSPANSQHYSSQYLNN